MSTAHCPAPLPTRTRRPFALALAAGLTLMAMWSPAGAQAPRPPAPVWQVDVVAKDLEHPWGLAFLPDGSMLVTERPGRLMHVAADGQVITAAVRGLPAVHARGQGGLLDVTVAPSGDKSPWVYWSYAEPGTGREQGLSGTAVARGRLVGAAMRDVQVVFRQQPKVRGDGHYGSRLTWAPDGSLFIALGDRQQDQPTRPDGRFAQNPANHLGKVVRIHPDGRPWADPSIRFGPQAQPGVWSIGHRNIQGAALHPQSGELWVAEHGPQGGDEINRVRGGRNHGWPLRSYGCPYGSDPNSACRVGDGRHAPAFEEPASTWVPVSTAPSGMVFYTGRQIPEWTGQLLVGSLAGQTLWRLGLDGDRVVSREAMFQGRFGRIRDVRQGPDGWIYLLSDDRGDIIRLRR